MTKESKVEQCCDNCGKDDDILFNYYKRRNSAGSPMWVCDMCFIDLEGISFEDYKGVSNDQE